MKLGLAIGVVVAAAAGWGLWSGLAPGVVVDVAEVERGLVREDVDERGETRLPPASDSA